MHGSSLMISQLRVTILNSSNDGRQLIAGLGALVTKKSVTFVSPLNVQDRLQIPCCGIGVPVYDTSVVVLGFREFSGRSICCMVDPRRQNVGLGSRVYFCFESGGSLVFDDVQV